MRTGLNVILLVVPLLTGFFAWGIPPAGQAQDACFGFCLTSEPGIDGATELQLSWPGAGFGSATVAYVLLRVGPNGLTGQRFGQGTGSYHESVSDSLVCFILVPEVYAGSGASNSRSSYPVCHVPLQGTPAPIRVSVSVSGFCSSCPVSSDRVRIERISGAGTFTAVGVPLPPGGTGQVWLSNPPGAPITTNGPGPGACYVAVIDATAPALTDLVCSLRDTLPAAVSSLPTPTPTPAPPTPTPLITPIASIPIASDLGGVAVNPTTNRIYVAEADGFTVTVIDGATHAVIDRTVVGTGPRQIAVNPATNRIYVTVDGSNSIAVIDGQANTLVANISVPAQPIAITVNPATNRVYVASSVFAPGAMATITVIDGTSNEIIATIAEPCCPSRLAANSATNRIYALKAIGFSVLVIDGASNTVIRSFASGSFPNDIAVDASLNRIYVATAAGQFGVFDSTSYSEIAGLPIPFGATRMVVNDATHRLFVATAGTAASPEHVVNVIDAAPLRVLGGIPIPGGIRGMAANPVTSRVYVNGGDSLYVIHDAATDATPQVERTVRTR